MGLVMVFASSVKNTFKEQWKEVITANKFDQYTAVAPAYIKRSDSELVEMETDGDYNVLTYGSKIFVPENTACFIFSQNGIEEIVTEPGGYKYLKGEASVFNNDGIKASIFDRVKERFQNRGVTAVNKYIAFVNLREIRDIKFGTRGPQMYNDSFYGCDLHFYAYGSFTIKITDPEKFVKNFLPAKETKYAFNEKRCREQIISDFLSSFNCAVNSLSSRFRISQLASQNNELCKIITNDEYNAGSWPERFGFEIVKVSIENIELSDDSMELINQFNKERMTVKAYENLSQNAANIRAQQNISEGIKNNGFGDAGGMIMGMNMANMMSPNGQMNQQQVKSYTMDEQIEHLKKLKELVDAGIITEEEFNIKKREIMGL